MYLGITVINAVRCYSVSAQLEKEMPMKPEILSYLYQHSLKMIFFNLSNSFITKAALKLLFYRSLDLNMPMLR